MYMLTLQHTHTQEVCGFSQVYRQTQRPLLCHIYRGPDKAGQTLLRTTTHPHTKGTNGHSYRPSPVLEAALGQIVEGGGGSEETDSDQSQWVQTNVRPLSLRLSHGLIVSKQQPCNHIIIEEVEVTYECHRFCCSSKETPNDCMIKIWTQLYPRLESGENVKQDTNVGLGFVIRECVAFSPYPAEGAVNTHQYHSHKTTSTFLCDKIHQPVVFCVAKNFKLHIKQNKLQFS